MKQTVVFKRSVRLLVVFWLFLPWVIQAAEPPSLVVNVSGKVTNENDEALIGVNILVKNTSKGTSTDFDGMYSLEDVDDDAVLVVSYVGYQTQEVPVDGRSVVNITLSSDAEMLDEVVVTALGLKRSEKSLGYSVGNVSGEDVNRGNQENVLNGLAGKIPGVSISSTGGTGSSVNMVIRGATSLNGDNQPLFVVDGIPISNSLNNVGGFTDNSTVDYGNAISDINPEDIESISVLKGPSAAALYGSRAGDGVVLITTKKGQKNEGLGISVSSNTVFDQPYKYLPLYRSRFAQGPRPYTPDNHPGSALTISEGDDNWVGPELDKGYSAVRWNSPLDEDGNPIPLPLVSHANPENFFQTGITSTNSIAIDNQKEDLTYRISYTNMNNRGILPNTDLNKNTLALSTSYNLAENFVISSDINILRNRSNNRPAGDRGTNPMQALADMNPSVDIRELRDYWEPGQEGEQQRTFYSGANNPWFLAYEAINGFDRNRIYGNVQASWQINPKFNLMARYGIDGYNSRRETKIAKSFNKEKNGVYGLENLTSYERNADFLANYRESYTNFDFDVSFGGNMMYQKHTNLKNGTTGGGLIIPGLYNIENTLPTSLNFSSFWSEKAIYSLYGIASFGYKHFAYLDLTARNDWSSTLPVENRSYFYPSASLSLLLDEMLHMPSAISLFKLRGGWAQVGKDTDPYNLNPILGNGGAWGDLNRQVMPGTLLNAQLKPEIATSYEFGADLAFLDNRLRLEGTYYNSDNKNQILSVDIPTSSGFGSKLINAGLVRSSGIELMLGVTPTSASSELQWDLNLNFSKNKTEIIELADGLDHFTLWTDAKGGAWTYVGGTIGDIYDRELVTVKDENSEYFGYPILSSKGSWQDYGGGRDEAVKIGNFNPDFSLGLQTSLSYKRFTLNAHIDWRSGGDFVSQTYRYAESDLHGDRFFENVLMYDGDQETLPQYLKDNADEYVKGIRLVGGPTKELGGLEHTEGGITLHDGSFIPGVIEDIDEDGNFIGYIENLGGPDTKLIRYGDNYPWSFTKAALFDASFVKLREISISYLFPQNISNAIGVRNLGLSLFSRNIMLWTKAKVGIDPETAFQPSYGGNPNGVSFRQGIERYNTTPWVFPIGIKLDVKF